MAPSVCRAFTPNALWFVVVVACLQNLGLKVMVFAIASQRGFSVLLVLLVFSPRATESEYEHFQ